MRTTRRINVKKGKLRNENKQKKEIVFTRQNEYH